MEGVTDDRSVHFLPFPKVCPHLFDADIERAFGRLQVLVERVRMMRESRSLAIKQPLRSVTVVSSDEQVLERFEGSGIIRS